jgi:hypothetical protein
MALLLVAGLTATMMIVNATMNTGDAVDNFAEYFDRSNAYDIALSGANMAANQLYFNKFYRGHWKNKVDMPQGGTLDVVIQNVGSRVQVISTGVYASVGLSQKTQQIVYYLEPGYFDRFVLLTDNDDGTVPWTTYDTARGALHSNNTLRMDHYGGNPIMPVFNGPVTTTRPITITAGTVPVFAVPPQSGVSVEFPTSFDPVTDPPFLPGVGGFSTSITAGNGLINLTTTKEVHLQFFVDGSGNQMIRYFRTGPKRMTNGYNPNYYGDFVVTDSVVAAPSDGIIYEPGVDVFVEGTVKGKLSVLTTPDGSGVGGNIIVTNDLLCNTNPVTDGSSPDFIGLLANNNVIIANTSNNNATTSGSNRFKIQASIVALTGGLAAADNITRKRQLLDIYGSITQKFRRAVGDGSLSIGSSTGGFMKGYRYDQRLFFDHALLMPKTPLLALDSWLITTVP